MTDSTWHHIFQLITWRSNLKVFGGNPVQSCHLKEKGPKSQVLISSSKWEWLKPRPSESLCLIFPDSLHNYNHWRQNRSIPHPPFCLLTPSNSWRPSLPPCPAYPQGYTLVSSAPVLITLPQIGPRSGPQPQFPPEWRLGKGCCLGCSFISFRPFSSLEGKRWPFVSYGSCSGNRGTFKLALEEEIW